MSQFAAALTQRLRAADAAARLARLVREDDLAWAHERDREHLQQLATEHDIDPD